MLTFAGKTSGGSRCPLARSAQLNTGVAWVWQLNQSKKSAAPPSEEYSTGGHTEDGFTVSMEADIYPLQRRNWPTRSTAP